MNVSKNRRIIHAIYEVMSYNNVEDFSFDVNDKNTPCVVNQNNNFKYIIDTVFIPNVKGEKFFIELDVYNSYDNQHYNIIIDEDEWDDKVLANIYQLIYVYFTYEKETL